MKNISSNETTSVAAGRRAPTFLSLHVGVGEEPGARGGEGGGHAELSTAGLAGGDLGRRLGFAFGGKEERK